MDSTQAFESFKENSFSTVNIKNECELTTEEQFTFVDVDYSVLYDESSTKSSDTLHAEKEEYIIPIDVVEMPVQHAKYEHKKEELVGKKDGEINTGESGKESKKEEFGNTEELNHTTLFEVTDGTG